MGTPPTPSRSSGQSSAEPTGNPKTDFGAALNLIAGELSGRDENFDVSTYGTRILETLNYGVVVADARLPGWPIVYCNAGFEAITGYSRNDAMGKNCHFLQRPSGGARSPENDPVVPVIRRALGAGEPCDVVLRNFRKDGTPFWNHLHLEPLRDQLGGVTHFVGTQQDITVEYENRRAVSAARRDLERRVRERTTELSRANESLYDEIVKHQHTVRVLRQADERYRGFVENAVVGIYQSSPNGHYIDVNAALARMYGYDTPAQLMAGVTNIAQDVYVDPNVRAEFRRRIAADGEVRGMEYQVRRRDGSIIWISEHARAIKSKKGRILRYEGIVRDISVRKQAEAERAQLEAQLNEAQKMEAIGTLAGGIAHDFNNILGAIIGYTELAADDLPPDSITHQSLQAVLEAGQRAKQLVDQILAFSRRSEPKRQPTHLRPIVREVVNLMRAALPSSIQVRAEFQDEADLIIADPVQVHQILMNLCTNAGHAMAAQGGKLTIRLEGITLGPTPSQPAGLPPGDYVRLSVTDTGHGMSPAVLARIFEPFFTTKPVGEGTGLGLSVVHGIVKAHGGDIAVVSQPDQGTAFHLRFPRSIGEAAKEDSSAAAPSTGTERILLVDDDTALRNALAQQLRRRHYRVQGCGDSRKALALFRSAPDEWDLLITDQTMPFLSGTNLAREIVSLRPGLPVLLSTGNLERVDAEEARTAGVLETLVKPLMAAELADAVRRVLDQSFTNKNSCSQ